VTDVAVKVVEVLAALNMFFLGVVIGGLHYGGKTPIEWLATWIRRRP
jgi:hypothetical protein